MGQIWLWAAQQLKGNSFCHRFVTVKWKKCVVKSEKKVHYLHFSDFSGLQQHDYLKWLQGGNLIGTQQ